MALFNRQQDPTPTVAENLFLQNQVKMLELNLKKMEAHLQQVEGLLREYQRESSENMKYLRGVANSVCDNEYAQEQLGGKNRILTLPAHELSEFIVKNWQKQRQEMIALIIDLQKTVKRKDGQLADLEAQLERMLQQQKEQATLYQITPVTTTPQFVDQETGEILSEPTPSSILVPTEEPESTSSSTSIHQPQTHLVLLENIENNLSEVQWGILKAIGEQGLSARPEIEKFLTEQNPGWKSQLATAFSGLKTANLVGEDTVNPGNRWFTAFHLEDLGLEVYKRKFKKPAILCEKHRLKKENATWDHGYTIKEVALLMENMGYAEISYARKENEIRLSNGKVWIPDITAYDMLAKKRVYAEVELGHHTQDDFNEKMEKARQVASELRFVTNDKKAMETIHQQVSQWKLAQAKAGRPIHNFTVFITTTKKLADKDWGNELPFK